MAKMTLLKATALEGYDILLERRRGDITHADYESHRKMIATVYLTTVAETSQSGKTVMIEVDNTKRLNQIKQVN